MSEALRPPPESVPERLRDALGIPEGQGARAIRLLLLVFGLSVALASLKAAQSGIFLSTYPRSWIPRAFGASAITLASASAVSVWLAARWGPIRLATTTLIGTACAIFALWTLHFVEVPGAPFGIYVVIEASAGLLVIQVWTVVSEVMDPRSAKRLYPMAGVGASMAWVLCGFVVPPVVTLLGTNSLLLLAPAVLLGCVAIVRAMVRHDLDGKAGGGSAGMGLLEGWGRGLTFVRNERLMRVAAVLAVLALCLEQLMDYQLMAAARERFVDAESIAGFYGLYFALTSAMSMAALLLLSGRLFSRLGATSALLVTPITTCFLALMALVWPGFAFAVLLRGGYRVLKQSVWSAAMQQSLLPLPSVSRSQARALTRGVLAPGGYAVVAGVLTLLPEGFPMGWLSAATFAGAAIAAGVIALNLRGAYVAALERAIDDRSLDLDAATRTFVSQLDTAAVDALADQIRDPDPHRAGLAAEILGQATGQAAIDALIGGLAHPDPDVRAIAVSGLANIGATGAVDRIGVLLEGHQDVEVRRAAARALRKLRAGPSRDDRVLNAAERDDDPHVRALCKVVQIEGHPSSTRQDVILPMMTSEEPAERMAAVQAMTGSMVNSESMRSALELLLRDPHVPTRRAAIRTAARLQLAHLLPLVLAQLDDPATAADVADTLDTWDRTSLDALSDWLSTAPSLAARHIAYALARRTDATDFVLTLAAHEEPTVRTHTLRALVDAVEGGRTPVDLDLLRAHIRREIAEAWSYNQLLADLAHDDGTPDWLVEPEYAFLAGEIERDIVEARRRILALLVASGSRNILKALEASDRKGSRVLEARVAELLEMHLSRSLATRIVPLFEPLTLRNTIEAGVEAGALNADALGDPLGAIVERGDEHLRRCAMLCYGERFEARYPELYAEDLPLMPLFERMRFLRSVPLFSQLSGSDLRSVAEILVEVDHPSGHRVIHKGDAGDELFVIVSGQVAVRDGGTTVAQVGPREFFGELSVLDREPRSADVQALTDVRLLRLRGADLGELMVKRPSIQEQVLLVLVRRLREATAKLA